MLAVRMITCSAAQTFRTCNQRPERKVNCAQGPLHGLAKRRSYTIRMVGSHFTGQSKRTYSCATPLALVGLSLVIPSDGFGVFGKLHRSRSDGDFCKALLSRRLS